MTSRDPDTLWSRLMTDGAEALSAEQRAVLGSWAEAPPPASPREAIRVRELAAALLVDGAAPQAVEASRLALAGFERFPGPRSEDRLDARRALAFALIRADQLDEAEAELERLAAQAAELRAGLAGWEAIILYHRAAIADRRGDQDKAPALLGRALALAEESFGPAGGWTDIIRRALANALSFLGRNDELTALCRRAALSCGDDAVSERAWLLQLAEQLGHHGPAEEMEAIHRRLAEISVGFPPLEQAEDLLGLGRLLAETHRAAEAVEPLARATVLIEGEEEAEPGLLAMARFWLAEAMARADGDPEAIHDLYRAAIEGFTEIAGPRDEATLFARAALGRFLRGIGLLEEAERELAAALDAAEAEGSPLAPALAVDLGGLRRRKLFQREKGRIFAWSLAQARERHGVDRLSLALDGLRGAAEHAEPPAIRWRLWAETAILLASVGHEDQAMDILNGPLAEPGAGAQRARVHAQAAAERLRLGQPEAAGAIIAQACAQADDAAWPDLIAALAEACGAEALDLARPLLPVPELPRLRDAMIACRVAESRLEEALALAAEPPLPTPAIARDLARLALREGNTEAAAALAQGLSGGVFDRDGVEILLRAGAEAEAMAAIGDLESGLAFVEGLSMAARHFGMKGDRVGFTRRAGEAINHLERHPLEIEALTPSLRRVADGALELMGKDQALVWGAKQLPEDLVGAFAAAMGQSLEDRRGLGEAGAGLEAGIALEQSRSLAAIGRWDESIAALSPLSEPQSLVAACVHVAETAAKAGDLEAAARALKAAFTRLAGADSQCGKRLGEAVAGLLPAEWRGAFADAALSKAAAMDDLAAAASFVAAAAHAAIGAVEPQ